MPNPLYSQYLDFAPTFRWGGREWGQGDQGSFNKYLRRRGINPAVWARKHPTAARSFSPIENQIYSEYQPQLSAMSRERDVQRRYYDRLMQNLGGFAGALGPLLGGIPGAVRGAYDQGANTMTAGGEGYGGVLNADQAANAAAGNQLLGAIDSPAHLEGGDAGGVLAGYAGWIPSTMMKETGAAWADRAGNFPKEAGLQANLMMKDLLRQASESDQEFSGRINDVLSGLPGARADLFQQRREARGQARDDRRDWYLKLAALEMSRGNADRANQYLKLANQRENRYANKDMGFNAQGGLLPGYKMGPNGPVKIGAGKKPKVVDWGDIQADIADEDLTVRGADPNKPWAGEIDLPMDYKTAYQTLWAKYSGMVKDKKRLRRLINKILRAKGIVKPPANSVGSPYQPDNTGP
jgi:hypothetical protein